MKTLSPFQLLVLPGALIPQPSQEKKKKFSLVENTPHGHHQRRRASQSGAGEMVQ